MTDAQTPDWLELAEIAQTRSLVYSLVILPFTALPDPGFAETVRNEDFLGILERLEQTTDLPADMRSGARLMLECLRSWPASDMVGLSEALGVERTRLYRGLAPDYGPPPPFEAAWTGRGKPVNAILRELARFYRRSGLSVAANQTERPDSISVELAFQRQLVLREEEAWRRGTPKAAEESLQLQLAFLTDHLAEWTPRFIEEALPQAKTGFYQGHLTMLRGFLADEEAYLRSFASAD